MFAKQRLSFQLFVLTFAFACSTASVAQERIFTGDKPTQLLREGAGEGPAWHPQLGLFFSGDGKISVLNAKSNSDRRVVVEDAGSNGLLFDQEGHLLVCQPAKRRVSRLNVQTGKLQVLTDSYQGKRYNQPNDLTVDSKGRIYFSDPKYGRREGLEQLDDAGREIEGVYRIDLDGSVSRVITHEVDRPNGLLVSPDDRFLFVADNHNNSVGAARKLWRFELKSNGEVDHASKKLLLDWKTGRGPDGMVMDMAGRLYVAGGLNNPNPPTETAKEFLGGIYVLSQDGTLLDFVPIPRDEVTNCTFGGADLKTLYITAGGTLWSIRTTSPGQLPWPKP